MAAAYHDATKIIYAGDVDFIYGPGHDGVGWYWVDAEYPEDSGAVGKFQTLRDAVDNIKGAYHPKFVSEPPSYGSWAAWLPCAFVHPHDVLDALEMPEIYDQGVMVRVFARDKHEIGTIHICRCVDWRTYSTTVLAIPGPFGGLTAGQCHATWQANRAALERGGDLEFRLTPEQIAAAKACL